MILVYRGDAPKKKKNPNRLIVDDAVNDDNSVSVRSSYSCFRGPCSAPRAAWPGRHTGLNQLQNLPASWTRDGVGVVALGRLGRPGKGRQDT